MNRHLVGRVVLCVATCLVTQATVEMSRAQGAPSADERIAALKASLQENQARLRQYEWVETTVLSLKGEEKSRKQQRCYYGADGKVQKLPIDSQPAPAPAQQASGGRRGARLKQRVVENKKDDMRDYMEQAAALIHQYLPPDPVRIQQAKNAGHVAITTPEPGRARVELTDYFQASDRLAIDVDAAAGHLSGVNLNTYLEKPEDAITLAARFGTLTDGTSYVAHTTLDVTAKNIRVVIENSGHRPMAR